MNLHGARRPPRRAAVRAGERLGRADRWSSTRSCPVAMVVPVAPAALTVRTLRRHRPRRRRTPTDRRAARTGSARAARRPPRRADVRRHELHPVLARVDDRQPGPGLRRVGGQVVGPGARVPGAEHVVGVADGVRRVARAHQLLGGRRLGRAAVQPAAARVVRRAGAARAGLLRRDHPRTLRRNGNGDVPRFAGRTPQRRRAHLLALSSVRRDLCSHHQHRRRAACLRPRPADPARGDPRQPARGAARGPGPVARAARLRRHRHPAARAGADRRPRRRAARRARPGQDPAAAHHGRAARRVDPGHRRLRARRAPVRADHPRLAAARRRASATTCRSRGGTATSGTPRSSPPRTPASPT